MPPDHKDSWYWMGLAISTALASGLNYDPTALDLSQDQQKLRKRIWWTCYMRDRFLSLGLHRPTRIKDHEFSVPPLELMDFELINLSADGHAIGTHCPTLHDIKDQLALADICVYRTRLGLLVEPVLRLQAAYDHPEHIAACLEPGGRLILQFDRVEQALLLWKESLPSSCFLQFRRNVMSNNGIRQVDNGFLNIHRSHLHMMFHTLIYSLHRPRFLPKSPWRMNPISRLSSDASGAKVLASALNIGRIVERLREQKLDIYLPVSGITIIFPAMVVSLLEMKCQGQALHQGATKRFLTCMEAMKTLQSTYTIADVAMDYLRDAMSKASIDLSPWDSYCDATRSPSWSIAESLTAAPPDEIELGNDITNSTSLEETVETQSNWTDDCSLAPLEGFDLCDTANIDLPVLLDEGINMMDWTSGSIDLGT